MSPYADIACDDNGNSIDNIGIASYWEDSLAICIQHICAEER